VKRARVLFVLTLLAGLAAADEPRRLPLDADAKENRFEVSVRKKGALKAFAHDHRIGATAWRGKVAWDPRDPERSSVELEVDATKLEVLDPWLDEKDRAKVRKTMLSDEVLDVEKHPTIAFTSQRVAVAGKDEGKGVPLQVTGKLELHGVARQVRVDVLVKDEAGTIVTAGVHQLKQSDFGIEPYSTALGTIAVEDEVQVEWTLVAREKPQSPSPAPSPRSSK
jgi:polyisoprenoid-binding protein YceI